MDTRLPLVAGLEAMRRLKEWACKIVGKTAIPLSPLSSGGVIAFTSDRDDGEGGVSSIVRRLQAKMTLQRLSLQMSGRSHYPALFEPTVPNSPVLWAVLEGRNSGRAVVDDAQRPSLCVLRTDAILTFASRRMDPSFLADAIAQFRRTGPVWLVWPSDLSSCISIPDANNVVQRVEFLGCDPGAPVLDGWRGRLPENCKIRPIDRHLLDRCEWRSEMEFYCGSLDNFLANGIGLCLMRGDEIIVEAYASSYGQGKAEIGAVTREAYRGRGYAPITCAFLIEVCRQRGLEAYWSCDADHQASIRVARKLGFREEKEYQILEYDGCDPPASWGVAPP